MRFGILEDLDGLGLPFELAFTDFAQVKNMPLDKLASGHPFVSILRNAGMLRVKRIVGEDIETARISKISSLIRLRFAL